MRITAGALAEALGATLTGDPDHVIERAVHPLDATAPSDLGVALIPTMIKLLADSPAEVLLLPQGVEPPEGRKAVIATKTPRTAIPAVTRMFDDWLDVKPGIHPSAVVSANASVHPTATIGPLCVVDAGATVGPRTILLDQVSIGCGAVVGADGLIHPGARIGHHVEIGDRVIIHHNASIGSDGFSFITPTVGAAEQARTTDEITLPMKDIMRVHSLGTVILKDDVEIGALTALDRGTFQNTVVGRNTKIDNQVQIGHNCVIGDEVTICGQAGLAGSVTISNGAVLGARAVVVDHCHVGENAVLGATSGCIRDVPPHSVVLGTPAVKRSAWLSMLPYALNIRQLHNQLRAVRKSMKSLEARMTQ